MGAGHSARFDAGETTKQCRFARPARANDCNEAMPWQNQALPVKYRQGPRRGRFGVEHPVQRSDCSQPFRLGMVLFRKAAKRREIFWRDHQDEQALPELEIGEAGDSHELQVAEAQEDGEERDRQRCEEVDDAGIHEGDAQQAYRLAGIGIETPSELCLLIQGRVVRHDRRQRADAVGELTRQPAECALLRIGAPADGIAHQREEQDHDRGQADDQQRRLPGDEAKHYRREQRARRHHGRGGTMADDKRCDGLWMTLHRHDHTADRQRLQLPCRHFVQPIARQVAQAGRYGGFCGSLHPVGSEACQAGGS